MCTDVMLVTLQVQTVICDFSHVGCSPSCSMFSSVRGDRMAICVHPHTLYHQDATLSWVVMLLLVVGRGCFSFLRAFRLTTRHIFPSVNDVGATGHFTQQCSNYSRAHLRLWVSSWSGWGSRWPSLASKRQRQQRGPGGAVFFTTELLDRMKWKRQREQREGHLEGTRRSTSCPAQPPVSMPIRKAPDRLPGPDPRSASQVRRWRQFVELWMRS